MHACGHDFHLTTIYGVALLLNEMLLNYMEQ